MGEQLHNLVYCGKKDKKAKYEEGKNRFINPYNFVPLSKICKRENIDNEPKLTGVMECAIKIKTPIIIPDTEHVEKDINDHKTYKFFKIGDKPAIPASSLRGVIRSTYETITGSCMSVLNDDIIARSKNPYEAGLLKRDNGELTLLKAKRYSIVIKDSENYAYGAELKFTGRTEGTTDIAVVCDKNGETGYFVRGEKFTKKKYHSIFKEGEKENIDSEKLNKAFEKYKEVLAEYKNPSINKKNTKDHEWYSFLDDYLEKFKNGEKDILPVWYKWENGRVYMSPAQIGKFAYYKSVPEMIDTFKPCTSREKACKACSLFGMIAREDNNESVGSKVRITDARFAGTPITTQITLGELASPHTSYLPFYANEKNTEIKNYDEFTGIAIRGRKYYWHFKPDTNETVDKNNRNITVDKNNRNITAEYIGPNDNEGEDFTFKIFFDGITKTQLDELYATVCLNENELNGSMQHKIGHGKPLGYGSVKMTVKSVGIRKYDEQGYGISKDEYKYDGSVILPNELQIMLKNSNSWTYETVHYPKVEEGVKKEKMNDIASHHWFTKNFKLGDGTAKHLLPKPKDEIKETNEKTEEIIKPVEEVKPIKPKTELKPERYYRAVVKEYTNDKKIKVYAEGNYLLKKISELKICNQNITKDKCNEILPVGSEIKIQYKGDKKFDGKIEIIQKAET